MFFNFVRDPRVVKKQGGKLSSQTAIGIPRAIDTEAQSIYTTQIQMLSLQPTLNKGQRGEMS